MKTPVYVVIYSINSSYNSNVDVNIFHSLKRAQAFKERLEKSYKVAFFSIYESYKVQ